MNALKFLRSDVEQEPQQLLLCLWPGTLWLLDRTWNIGNIPFLFYCPTNLSSRPRPAGFVTGRNKPSPGSFQSLHGEEKNPFIMFTSPHCFISLENITHYQMVFVRRNWQTLEALCEAVWMEKSQSCCLRWKKILHLIFFMIPADMMYVCIPQPEEFSLFGFLCLSVTGSSTSPSFCSIVWELTTTEQ